MGERENHGGIIIRATPITRAFTPGLVRSRVELGKVDAKKRTLFREQLARVRAIATRHREATSGGAQELHRIAQWLADQWTPEHEPPLD